MLGKKKQRPPEVDPANVLVQQHRDQERQRHPHGHMQRVERRVDERFPEEPVAEEFLEIIEPDEGPGG